MTLYRNFKSCGSISGLQFGIDESLTNIPGSSQCVLKNHFLTSLAGRSANIAALPFLLVSVHTSLTKTTSLPDMECGARRVRPPMTRTRSDTPLQSILTPLPPSDGTRWPPLAPCALSVVSAVSLRAIRGGNSKRWVRARKTASTLRPLLYIKPNVHNTT